MRGNIYTLPAPFFVLATQNPIELEGTYPLPEAQLDRFLFNTVLDYLSADEELKVVDLTTTTHVAAGRPVTNAEEILDFQQLVRMVPIGESRRAVRGRPGARHAHQRCNAPDFVKKYVNFGASVRAAQFLVLAAKARALMHGRYHVTYEDIRALYTPVLRHRVLLNFHAESDRLKQDDILKQLLEWKPRPRNRVADRRLACSSASSIPRLWPASRSLDLVAKTVVDGFVAGLHRSPDFGFSQEFAEYRAYTPGDDLRHVDWNVFARTERCLPEALSRRDQHPVLVLLDTSASMGVSARTRSPSSITRASWRPRSCYMAQSAARCGRADRLRRRRAELRAAFHAPGPVVPRCCTPSRRPSSGTRTDFAKPFVHFQNFLHRRGIVVVISDFYEQPETIVKTVEPLRYRGNEVILFHVLDPQEIAAEVSASRSLLVDMEDRGRAGSFARIRAQRIPAEDRRAHRSAARPRRSGAGIDYFLVDTGRPLDEGLREYLTVRQGRL